MKSLVVSLVAVALLFGAQVLHADPDLKLLPLKKLKASKKLCETTWPNTKKPSRATTRRCMQYWLYTKGYVEHPSRGDVPSADFGDDPESLASPKHRAREFLSMAKHIKRAYPGDDRWPIIRAIEMFERSAESYTTFHDMYCDIAGSLKQILEDQKVTKCQNENAQPSTLWLLRNAVYAKHGRKFKHPDLNHFFYGKWKRDKLADGLPLPLRADPKFRDSMLTKQDRSTVRVIRKAEKAKTR